MVLYDIHTPNAKNSSAFALKLMEILINVYQEDNVFVHMFLGHLWACTKDQWGVNRYPMIITKFQEEQMAGSFKNAQRKLLWLS